MNSGVSTSKEVLFLKIRTSFTSYASRLFVATFYKALNKILQSDSGRKNIDRMEWNTIHGTFFGKTISLYSKSFLGPPFTS